jgi:hypothetical protein
MLNPPSWYVPYSARGRVSPEERADSEELDEETGETARRIREQDRMSREWNAAHPNRRQSPAEERT